MIEVVEITCVDGVSDFAIFSANHKVGRMRWHLAEGVARFDFEDGREFTVTDVDAPEDDSIRCVVAQEAAEWAY